MNSSFDMSGKTILITGASSGIGRETAVCLSQSGARLILVGRDEKKLEETRALLTPLSHLVAPFDLNQTHLTAAWLKEIAATSGLLDGIVHAAGIHLVKPLKFMELKDYRSIFETNVSVSFDLCKAYYQKGVANRPSSIVFVSSAAGLQGQAGISAYSASKGALIALTKSLAMEFSAEKIRVNCVVPGVVMTPMTEKLFNKMSEEQIAAVKAMHPLGFGTANDVANAIVFLLSNAANWITGTSLIVDGGYCAH